MELLELAFEKLAFGGEAIGRGDGMVVFVPYALPGERARVQVVERKRDYVRGDIVELLQPSEARVQPPCPYFLQRCGGCHYQHAAYAAQLAFKRGVVVEQLARIGRFQGAEHLVRAPIGMLSPWNYRNQARFTPGPRRGELCFTQRSSHRLLRVDHCWIVHPRINQVLARLQGELTGLRLHQLVVRVGANTGDLLVSPALPHLPDLPTGQDFLEEELLGRRFRIAASAFFQVNTLRELRPLPEAIHRAFLPLPSDGVSIAELLALLVLDRLEPRAGDFVVDAYCGVGTFAVLVAPFVGAVVGIEESSAAVRDARHNARALPNVRFEAGKVEEVLPRLGRRPDAVVLDPARVGCHPDALRALLDQQPSRLVYVSCDPTTLARDLRMLCDGGFQLLEVQPLDMFPQTYHVESVAVLAWRGQSSSIARPAQP